LLPVPDSVIGRETELARVEQFLAETRPPAALVLAGPAGIGKTTLWQAGVADAREREDCLLVSRPLEADAGLSLAGLADLLGELVDDVAAELPEPQERALMTALLRDGADGPPVDPRALNAAVHGVLRAVASERPVVVAIDDVQWLDPPSLSVLRHAMRRLPDDEVRLLIAARAPPSTASPDLGLAADRMVRVAIGPLELEEIGELIARELDRHLPRPILRQIAELSGGNPFYALELCRSTDRGSTDELAGFAKGEDLQRLVGDRLAALPQTTRDALGTIAALGRPTTPVVAEVVDEEATLDAAFRAGVLEEDGEQLRFAHPLLAAAAYDSLPPRRRREAHARLAMIVEDPEERARHLAAATVTPDPAVAAALDAGARAADARGAPASAAELLERAASLTPDEDRASAAHRQVDAARHHISAGNERRGLDICGTVVAELRPGPLRAEALRTLATSAHIPVSEAIASGRRAVEECGDNPDLRVDCLLSLSEAMRGHDFHTARAIAEDALATARRASQQALQAALTSVGELETMMTPGGGREMLREALALGARPVSPPGWWDPAIVLGAAHLFADELDEARSLLDPARKRAMDAGDEVNAQDADRTLAQVELGAGNLVRARALAEEGMAIGDEGEPSWSLSGHLFARAQVAAHEGDADLARELTERGLSMAAEVGDEIFPVLHHSVLGSLELSLGNPAEAVSHLDPLWGRLGRLGVSEAREPGAFFSEADAIEALIGVGRIDEAETRLARWEELGRAIDRPRVLAAGARARGLIAAERGDLASAVACLEEAVVHHERLLVASERGRTLIALGATYRRAGRRRDARATLHEALELFEQTGARIWADRARAELGRLGGRTASGDELTPTELRVAELVAKGRTNKEVASALFVTVRTVEANLTRIYSKLGIRSRSELAARAARASDDSSS
jgi:DNA-binding CsgD family transcriptional regulator